MSLGSTLLFLLLILLAYLSGSFSPSYFLGRLLLKDDLRKHGSGNLGATNAARILGKGAGLVVVAVDILKGALPVLLLHYAMSDEALATFGGKMNAQLVFGLAAVLGHCFPFYLRWRGGKGVLTGLGAFLVIAPIPLSIGLAVGLTCIATLRYVSIGSMLGTAALAFAAALIRPEEHALIVATTLTALFVIFTHRQNVVRLFRGQEHKLGSGKEDQAESANPDPGVSG